MIRAPRIPIRLASTTLLAFGIFWVASAEEQRLPAEIDETPGAGIARGTPGAVAAEELGPRAQGADPLAPVEFFLGEWDVESRAPDGQTVVGRARTRVRKILDGRAIQADYYGLDPAGNTIFRGTTIRTWSPGAGRFIVHWAMADLPGYTYLLEEYRGGQLHATGHGVDGQGEFLERYRYFDISETTYSFEMSRSYDGGESWQPYANLRATKRVDGRP